MRLQQQVDEGNITPVELQAELDTLRSLRRRSISQPSDGIDPDLPPSPSKYSHGSPPPSPKQLHPAVGGPSDPSAAFAGPSAIPGSSNGNRSHGPSHLSSDIVEEEEEPTEDQPLADNLSELFWLPARLHPEIAPQEFRNFIRDQTKPENLLRRSGSQLGRRKSMLSRQYQPSDTDTESASLFTSYADSTPGTSPSVSRRPSRAGSFRRSSGLERLTLADLQKLETIARQAAEEGQTGDEGEAQLKRLVRRSLSLNPAAILGVAADQLRDDDSYVEDDTDSPLIVPPPGSILRRSARTKIRKNSLLGDGGGHRFGPSRRGTKGVESPLSEDSSRPSTSRRQASISSLTSTEEDAGAPQTGRPTSAEFRRRSPRSPESSEKSQYTSEPLPMQYVPSSGLSLAERMESADLGPEDSNKMTVSPVRAGADMPQSDHSPTGALQWTSAPAMEDGYPKPAMPTAGSLRTAKRIGGQAQVISEFRPRTSSAGAKPLSPPPSALSLPASPEASSLHLFDAPAGSKTIRAGITDNRPAVPVKPSDVVQVELQASAPIKDKQSVESPQTRSKTEMAARQERPKSVTDAKASQIPRKAPTSPVTASPKEKEKKSTWAKLGLSRSTKDEADLDDAASIASTSSGGSGTFGRKGKKTKKDKVQDEISPEKKAPITNVFIDKADKQDGSASFFGGLFGKKKGEQNEPSKKDGTQSPTPMQMPTPPPTASGMLTPDGKYINFYRLPIHIERAVYRLSHIKLANPRRPLYEQVLISNLMFWYLGVINKPVGQPSQVQQRSPPEQQQVQPVPAPAPVSQASGAESATNEARPLPAPQPSRPRVTRENSSNSGTTVPAVLPRAGAEGSLEQENGSESGSVASQRPASHPPSIVRSPSTELADAGNGSRSRPQTMPANGSIPVHEEAHPPPKQATQPYRYQDYISTAGSVEPSFNGYQTVKHQAMIDTASGERDRDAWQDASARKARRFSSETAETDDVRYDGRQTSVELDTYDIIAAYADEERRKSMIALQTASEDSKGASSASPPSSSVSHRNGHKSQVHEDGSRGLHNSAHRATPPRQSSIAAHAAAAALPGSTRHMAKSPPPPRAHSPSTLPSQS